jgi:hypothetical protein
MEADDADRPRTWRKLSEEQQELAAELVRRALELREVSDGELSIREAVQLAADAVERRGARPAAAVTAELPPVEAVPDGR